MNVKHYIKRIIIVIIPIVIIIGLFFLPGFLNNDSQLVPLSFHILEQNVEDDTLILKGQFNQDILENESVWLYANHTKINIKYDSHSIVLNTRDNTPSIFQSPGSDWFHFQTDGIPKDKVIEISITAYYGNLETVADKTLDHFYIGDGSGLYQQLLDQINFFDMIIICAFIAGMLYLVEGTIDIIVGIDEVGKRIFIFGFYCFSGGLWCITDIFYPYLSLFISPAWMASLIDMIGLLLFPIAIAAMLRHNIRGYYTHKVMDCLFSIEVITAIVSLVIQFMGWVDLYQLQVLLGIKSFIILAIAMICIVIELKKYRDQHLMLLFLTVLPVFICEILNSINFFYTFMTPHILMQYSFSVSVLMLIIQIVSYAHVEIKRNETFHQIQEELVDSRISIMLSQIHPHFIYNSLLGIKQLCDIDPKRASDALEHFSYYLRGNLDSLVDTRLISFDKELDHLNDYLYLEKMRFSKKLNIIYDIQYTDFMLPPLTIQPIVENAIRYGIVKRSGGGTVVICCQYINHSIILTISDNGIGFDINEVKNDGRSHVGIENVRSRIETLCNGSLTIESQIGIGTKVEIVIPQREETE